MNRTAIILSLTIIVLLNACANNSENNQSELAKSEKIIVETDAGDVTEDELNEALKEQYGKKVLKDLILNKVIASEAEKIGISEDEIQSEIEFLKNNIGVSNEDQFYEVMEREGVSGEEDLHKLVMNHLVMQHRIGLVGEATDEELLDEYEKGETVEASHILVENEETALEVITQLQEGQNFRDLAKEYSQDPGTKEKGGNLGSFRRGTMTPPFEEAAFSLDINEISEPIQSQFGYHIIKTTGRTPFEDGFTEVREQLRSHYNDRKLSKMNAEQEKIMENTDIIIHAPEYKDLYE